MTTSPPTPKKTYTAAIIGTGRPKGQEGSTGAAISRHHAYAYRANQCEMVALADIRAENAEAFREEQGFSNARIYTDYEAMLREAKPDVVSICTWPHLHAEMVIACAAAGIRAVHCEKPMAPTFGEARRMHEAAARAGMQLTFNHQRRFEEPYVTCKRLIDEAAVGQLIQMQAACPNLYDWGTHWFDMLFFYNGDVPAHWVMGQVHVEAGRAVFGVRLEDQGMSYVGYQNGVRGMLITGDFVSDPALPSGPAGRRSVLGAAQRIIGTEGMIEVAAPGSRLRLLNAASVGWTEVPVKDHARGIDNAVTAAIADKLRCLETGAEPLLSSHKAIRTTELIFGTYESARRRARVDFPLQIDDNPLHALLDAGEIDPKSPPEEKS
ncbi:MAG: Gfo/Idh/MocA family protein [Chloroflexota bacterium]